MTINKTITSIELLYQKKGMLVHQWEIVREQLDMLSAEIRNVSKELTESLKSTSKTCNKKEG